MTFRSTVIREDIVDRFTQEEILVVNNPGIITAQMSRQALYYMSDIIGDLKKDYSVRYLKFDRALDDHVYEVIFSDRP